MDEKMIKNNCEQKINWKEHALISLKVFFTFAIILGIVYPLFITGISHLTMKNQAEGSLIYKNETAVGSEIIAQNFTGEGYFHPRPSAVDYDASNSGASNLAVTSEELKTTVTKRIEAYRKENGIDTNVNIPSDAVTASASGLDPHISLENAKLQSKRVAKKRNLEQNDLEQIINKNIDPDFIGIWGQDGVNVTKLNMALDNLNLKGK